MRFLQKLSNGTKKFANVKWCNSVVMICRPVEVLGFDGGYLGSSYRCPFTLTAAHLQIENKNPPVFEQFCYKEALPGGGGEVPCRPSEF